MIMLFICVFVAAIFIISDKRNELVRVFENEFEDALAFKRAVDAYNKMHVRQRVRK